MTDTRKRLTDLVAGQSFRFRPDGQIWEYRGNRWFGRPYSGGPYVGRVDELVYPLEEAEEVAADLAAGLDKAWSL